MGERKLDDMVYDVLVVLDEYDDDTALSILSRAFVLRVSEFPVGEREHVMGLLRDRVPRMLADANAVAILREHGRPEGVSCH